MKNIKFLVISLAFLVISSIYLAAPAVAATRVSGISVQSACNHQYGSGTTAELFGKTAINWDCLYMSGRYVMGRLSVDLSRECRRIYGSSAYAAYTNYWNPYSWGCYR